MGSCSRTCWVVGTCVFVYFVIYPADLVALVQPFGVLAGAVSEVLGTILRLSSSISPWLYGTVIAALACWTATRAWGRTQRPPAKKTTRAKAG